MPLDNLISPTNLPHPINGRIENAATKAEGDFDKSVRKVFVTGLNSMRLGIAGVYLFHKAHSDDAIKKMLEAAEQDYKSDKGDLYPAIFVYAAKDIEEEISDITVWATHRANCCRRLKQLDEQKKNAKHFKNAETIADFIKSEGGMVKIAEAYKASQNNTTEPPVNDNPNSEDNGQAILYDALKRLPFHDTDYALPSGASEFVTLLAQRNAKGNASILGSLEIDADSLPPQLETLLQCNHAGVQNEVLCLHRLIKLSEIFSTEQILISAKGKTVLIPQIRTSQNHKKAIITARIFVSLKRPFPVSGEIKAGEFKILRKGLKSPDSLYRYALTTNDGGTCLFIKSSRAEFNVALEPMQTSAAYLVKPKLEKVTARFTLPIEFLNKVINAEEMKETQTTKLIVSHRRFKVGQNALPISANFNRKLDIDQDLLTKTFRLLTKLTDGDIEVRTYQLPGEISFHLVDDHGDFGIEFAGFEED